MKSLLSRKMPFAPTAKFGKQLVLEADDELIEPRLFQIVADRRDRRCPDSADTVRAAAAARRDRCTHRTAVPYR